MASWSSASASPRTCAVSSGRGAGIGVFFGTFNPFHKTHLSLVQRALAERGLEKVVIHPTVLPRFHRMALARGEIAVSCIENGFQVMERTELADSNVDYFPTGNKFLPPETRRHLIELALEEAGLSDRVEVAFFPKTYEEKGFHGVLARIRREQPRQSAIHGIHGSDWGGMLVRAILDECGWIYPLAVRRRDGGLSHRHQGRCQGHDGSGGYPSCSNS